jgi:thermitase
MSYFVYQLGAKKKVNSKNISRKKDDEYSALIIKYRGGYSESIRPFHAANGIVKQRLYDKASNIYLCYCKKTTINKLALLAKKYYDSGIAEFAEPYVLHTVQNSEPAFNDPRFPQQWIFENTGQMNGAAGEDIGIMEGLQLIVDNGIPVNKEICVAVLDEGVDTAHADLNNANLWQNNFSVFGANKLLPKEEDHHGTSVAGVIAAIQNNGVGIAGINPFCKIMSGRIYFTQDNTGIDPLKISQGIRQAVDLGARVINLSWRIEPSPVVADAIKHGFNKNVVFCAAAGNYTKAEANKNVQFPGSMDEVITVAACNHLSEWVNLANSPDNQKFGSCFGREVDIAAPGLHITTTKNDGGYSNIFCGTSAATAIVSAVAAIVLAVNPALSNIEVRDILLSTASNINGASTEPSLERVGRGKINAKAAIQKAIDSLGQ